MRGTFTTPHAYFLYMGYLMSQKFFVDEGLSILYDYPDFVKNSEGG
jgi:hypothetical protein